ncbi:hypothetical protein BJY04DRAFT_128513 [Aspergillus karnatakaensis]|uniref:Zn(II)2Cys6 transcription factor domain-containing protein n=1 Tax=Aspergillus karnatakaensis TaxID=1810916 RepID=UPI003CCD7694
MVNRGPSNGCVTCKQRRVKCDEGKPSCRNCQRLKLECGGYKTKLKIKDESLKFLRPVAEPDTAVPFFLQHYASMEADIESARGYFEMLVPVYSWQKQSSPLSLAVSAVASEILSLWRGNNFPSRRNSFYNQAVAALRDTLQDRDERGKPATMLAILSLQLHDNLAAVYSRQRATRIHHNGAMSLLPLTTSDYMNPTTSGYVRNFIIHSEISSAMRQERPLNSVVYTWISDRGMAGIPDNPSATLDTIGASVAEFQAGYRQLLERTGTMPSPQPDLKAWRAGAKSIDDQLLLWAKTVPAHWQPLRLISGRDFDPSIITYQSTCEVYSSCLIGKIWNLWRVQRLLLVRIGLSSLNLELDVGQSVLTKQEVREREDAMLEYIQTLQELVDGICYSVPFFLGNRVKPSGMSDFTDSAILLPGSCGQPASPDPGRSRMRSSPSPASKEDQNRRHIIAQGHWHIMNPLSRLLMLFAEDGGSLKANLLRPGQHKWIGEQFLRVMPLLNIQPGGKSAEQMARVVRQGASFMSGP